MGTGLNILTGLNPAFATPKVASLPELVIGAAAFGDKQAWFFEQSNQSITFHQIAPLVAKTASVLLAQGITDGQPVALMCDNTMEFPISWLALSWLGAPMVPMNPRYGVIDATHLISTAGVKTAIVAKKYVGLFKEFAKELSWPLRIIEAEGLLEDAANAAEIQPVGTGDSIANIQFTSGTTGAPKGCVLGQEYWIQIAHTLTEEFPNISSSDTMLTAQPFYYIDPQWNLITSLYSGAKLVVLDGFHPSSFFERVRHYGVTYFYCLGMMPNLLLKMPADAADKKHRVRAVEASAIPTTIHAELEERFGVSWYEAFGMTETGADIFVPEEITPQLAGNGSIGRPRNHREVKIVDSEGNTLGPGEVGRLMIAGPGMMRGYFNDPESTMAAFDGKWFDSGDLASFDEDGLLYHRGRTKDMIRRSGENISAAELETLLNSHPKVKISGAISVSDDLRGEEVLAVIEPTQPVKDHPLFFQELVEYCEARVASFKVPRYFKLTDQMPLTVSERVSKKELKQEQFLIKVWDKTTGEVLERVDA